MKCPSYMLSGYVSSASNMWGYLSNERLKEAADEVPDDVIYLYGRTLYAVLAINGEEAKRFIVELHFLTDPAFLGLLDQELHKILDDMRTHTAKVLRLSLSY
ncbi:hypothetical protein PIB30_017366 [Stylosanthes scabra]|uniref:Uncharacterized protein n=1 Tax=Stylosanthes scabra TaxID=79078 RepID=A0ABU6U6D9_9FABA|nr:hypothetical protein [Stylosanthes scabra]